MNVKDAAAARIRRERMAGIVPRPTVRCQSGLELGARALLVAVPGRDDLLPEARASTVSR
jgi:hypothetical protein